MTLPGICYTVCSGIPCMFCIAYILLLQTYAHLHVHIAYAHLYVHFGHVTTSKFISITSPLDNIIYDITWKRLETWPDDNMLIGDGIKIWHCYDIVIFLLIIKFLLYGITITESCIIYYYRACIQLLPPSFYHSLGRFLMTLGLHAQVGAPSYRIIRECLGVT